MQEDELWSVPPTDWFTRKTTLLAAHRWNNFLNLSHGSPPRWAFNISQGHWLIDIKNAFSECLGCLGFNIFCALVIDLLHEFEIGIHLLCIICAQDKGLIHELDRRYDVSSHTHWSQLIFTTRFRQTPTFGQATIHKFSTDSSEMKRMAARNFEGRIWGRRWKWVR